MQGDHETWQYLMQAPDPRIIDSSLLTSAASRTDGLKERSQTTISPARVFTPNGAMVVPPADFYLWLGGDRNEVLVCKHNM